MLVGIACVVFPAPGQTDVEQVCTLGATLRRIEVIFADGRGAAPCEVAYVKETEQPGERSVLWTAERDGDFCIGKARELANRLEQAGWRCDGGGAPETAADTPPVEPPAPPPERPENLALGAAGDDGRSELPEPAPRTDEAAVADTNGEAAEPDQRDGAAPELAAAPGRDPEEASRPGSDVDDALASALEAAVARDLARLKTTAEDSVEASIEGFGDLNGDEVLDAAILITFDADGSDHAQYLVAYVAEEGSFRPAASRFIGGRYRKIFGADVRAIEDGRIRLELKVLEPEDPYCCPSGSEAALFALQNGELVMLPSP